MATTYIIDPFEIATQGVTSGDSLTIATQGFIVKIEEEIIEVPVSGAGPEGYGYEYGRKLEKKKKLKKITVTVIIGKEKYIESKTTENLKITAQDVEVKVIDAKPKITFNF